MIVVVLTLRIDVCTLRVHTPVSRGYMYFRTENEPFARSHNARRAVDIIDRDISRILLLCHLQTRCSFRTLPLDHILGVRQHRLLWNLRSRPQQPAGENLSVICFSRVTFSYHRLTLTVCVVISRDAHCKLGYSPRDYYGPLLTGFPSSSFFSSSLSPFRPTVHCARRARWLIAPPRWLIGCRLLGKLHSLRSNNARHCDMINNATNVHFVNEFLKECHAVVCGLRERSLDHNAKTCYLPKFFQFTLMTYNVIVF